MVAHVSMAHPVNPRLGDWCAGACESGNIPMQRGGTYLVMEGPQFSTLAESQLYRQWNCDVIGMTNMPEAKLAREAEIPYCTVAMVLLDNADKARRLVRTVAARLTERPALCPSGDDRALDAALITHPDARDPAMLTKLDAVAGRALTRETS